VEGFRKRRAAICHRKLELHIAIDVPATARHPGGELNSATAPDTRNNSAACAPRHLESRALAGMAVAATVRWGQRGAAAAARAAQAPLPRQRGSSSSCPARGSSVVARSILDSYRRERGLPVEGQPAVVGCSGQGWRRANWSPCTPSWPPPRHRPLPLRTHLVRHTHAPARPALQPVPSAAEDAPCPVECVKALERLEQLDGYFASVSPTSLVVLDLYKTSCGACRCAHLPPGATSAAWRSGPRSSARCLPGCPRCHAGPGPHIARPPPNAPPRPAPCAGTSSPASSSYATHPPRTTPLCASSSTTSWTTR
jgi:hypothetical protein